jgi:Hg(II)-responsive transcriptional regulator
MTNGTLRIGEVAARAEVNVQTLRYYERRGILREPERGEGNQRAYPADTVKLIRFIKRAQELGFALREIEELLRLKDDRRASCAQVRGAARSKIEDIDDRVRALRRMRRALTVLVDSCVHDGSVRECPILEALAEEGAS